MTARARCEAAFRAAVAACDPERAVRRFLLDRTAPPSGGAAGRGQAPTVDPPPRFGLAIGKAALAMARGAGEVERGVAIAPRDDGRGLPRGWTLMLAAHPEPDERSVAAGRAAVALVEAARGDDVVLALISGGASALCEVPRVPLPELRARVAALVMRGAPIAEVNAARTALSAIKGGQLAERCVARMVTLIASDVIGDSPRVVGSGPTVGPVGDIVRVVAPMRGFAEAMAAALGVRVLDPPIAGDAADVCARLAAEHGSFVAWGEPTVALPADHGRGGRAQHLALLLARALRGTRRCALVAASDGVDGPPPAAAGAFVDGATWDALDRTASPSGAASRSGARALVAPDAALAAFASADVLGAHLFDPGATGIDHGDIVAML